MPVSEVLKMDWKSFKPDKEMVLCFVIDSGNILLMRKKRGIGKGKINAPGGKIEKGEEPGEACVRETEEEVGIIPSNPEKVAELLFEDLIGEDFLVHVFVSEGYDGEVVETEEAKPMWFPINAIPYNEMWEDDEIWLPEILSGKLIRFWAKFEGEKMIEWEMEEV